MREGRGEFLPRESGGELQEERRARLWREYQNAQSGVERMEALERLLEDMLERSDDPFTRELITKYLAKIDIKRRVRDIDDHWDDGTYQDVKGLGIFLAHHRTIEHDIEDPKGEVDLRKGDVVLDLHLPPVSDERRKRLRSLAEASMRQIAAYIQEHGLQPKYITGITYEALARLTPRFGFHIREIPLPPEMTAPVAEIYARHERRGKPIGRVMFVYQTLEEFMRRWGEHAASGGASGLQKTTQ